MPDGTLFANKFFELLETREKKSVVFIQVQFFFQGRDKVAGTLKTF